jgi:PIN domain nuclease of toxin-antitoxin system
MPKGSFIFDSHALLKFFQKEKGYEKVVHLLEEIKKSGATKYINAIEKQYRVRSILLAFIFCA